MKPKIEFKNDKKDKYEEKISLKNIKDSILSLYSHQNQYNEVIQKELLINEVTKNKNFDVYFPTFIKKMNYINKIFFSDKIIKNSFNKKLKNLSGKKSSYFIINSFIILRKFINTDRHTFIKKFFKILLLFKNFNLLSLNLCKLILELYINLNRDLIANKNNLFFIDDLIEAIITFVNEDQTGDKNILYFIISIIEQCLLSDFCIKMKIQKSNIFLKFLKYKTKDNKYENDEILINFLVGIYKYNITTNFLYEQIYKEGILDLNYYSNALTLLSLIFKEENIIKKDIFHIKNAFYIQKNIPLILEKIKIKEQEYSIIFSFRLFKEDINEDNNNEKDIIIFNFYDEKGYKKSFFSFCLCKNKDKYNIKIIIGENNWKINNISITVNKDYFICLSKTVISNQNNKMTLYINDKKLETSTSNTNNKINEDNKKNNIYFQVFENQFQYKSRDEMILKLGEQNFEGLIGDFLIINTKLNKKDITNLLNFNGDYSLIAEMDSKTDLINKLNDAYLRNKENITYFKKLNFKCILKILVYKINPIFNKIENGNEYYINNFGILKHENKRKIDIFSLNNSLNKFVSGNGVEFLVFQLHNLFSLFDKNNITQNELYIFNLLLYKTFKLYHYIIQILLLDEKANKKSNFSAEFNYFFISFLIIVDYYKKINKYLRMNLNIYNLLLEFISFCDIKKYYDQRNLILSILLDESLFNQEKVLKECNILNNIDFILAHELYDEDLFNEEILYKILNLQFILQSKHYNHKLYMKIIMKLMLTENKKIYKKIFEYMINLKKEGSEVILYHYLKSIFLNYQSVKNIIESENIMKKFLNFLVYYLKNNNFYHCQYCFKIFYLIFLIQHELKRKISSHIPENNNDIKKLDLPPELTIVNIINKIKSDFIYCFDINNEKKLKFVKNYGSIILDNNRISEDNKIINDRNKEFNKSNFNLDLLKDKIKHKKFIKKCDEIIKNLESVYTLYAEYLSPENNNTENKEKYLLLNIFHMINFSISELINYKKSNINESELINLVFKQISITNFYQIYFKYDCSKAGKDLQEIIVLTIEKIKSPFYFEFIKSDSIIDSKNETNNIKIKNEIFKLITNEFNNITDFQEIINYNKGLLLIIINEILYKNNNIPEYVEKFILTLFLFSKNSYQYYNFYKINGEYYNIYELQLEIIFQLYKLHKYDKQTSNMIRGFIFSMKRSSIFYLIDIKSIKEENYVINNKDKDNNNEQLYFPNLLNVLYFLIYFLSIKNNDNDNIQQISNKNILINELIEITFNDCLEIFKIIKKKKITKKFILKTDIRKFDMYIYLFNILSSKDKNPISLEKFEEFYARKKYENSNNKNNLNNNEINNNFIIINKSGDKKKIINSKSSKIVNDFSSINSNENINNFSTNHYTNSDNISINLDNSKLKENERYSTNKIKEKKYNIKALLNSINIPLLYYKKLINHDDVYFTKLLINPKAYFFWTIFIYSLKDIIFYNKNFIKLSKSFKIFSKDYVVESSSKEEMKFHLDYPSKIKNFICDDYYRPFLKPDLKFFNRDLIKISHSYINIEVLEKIRKKFDISKIRFIKYFPINTEEKDDTQSILVENISYRGSILGKIYLKDSFLVFINDFNSFIEMSPLDPVQFCFLVQDIASLKLKTKSLLIYYSEIKEIVIRRFFLKRLGYEIFLKNGRSYLFNFFNSKNMEMFQNFISKKDISIINDPVKTFEKREYKNKFKKGEISNFQYLLLLNKYSTRSYNNINQYLVFPLLYLNLEENSKRDLSKAICLNKTKKDLELKKYIENYNSVGFYFNNHYSTSAYVLYYLVRVIPYTYLQIEFQSGKFDVPERIFNNYNSYSCGILNSSENRELIPEIFHSFEIFINLNHNNFGKMIFTNDLINNFNSNRYSTSVEFIINHRISLEKSNITPWINNVFGYNQINTSKEAMNLFPLSSYEQFYEINVDKIKEKLKNKSSFEIYQSIRIKLAILDIGISPIQLFKSPHPEKNAKNNFDKNELKKGKISNINDFNRNNSISYTITDINSYTNQKNKKTKVKENKANDLFESIKKFTIKNKASKYKLYLNDKTMNLFFIFKDKITIYNIQDTSKNHLIKYPIQLDLSDAKLINLEKNFSDFSKNIIRELVEGFYCICRNDDRTLKFINIYQHSTFSFLWPNIITSIEPFNYNMLDYNWKIIFGDEEGFLCELKLIFEYIIKTNDIKIIDIQILKKVKIHKNYINCIDYNHRLNIITSSSINGDIAINNGDSFEILNMIKVGDKYLINNIQISIYDLLYFVCYNNQNQKYYLKCYTLNGIKVTKFKTKKRIINFYINENINVVLEDYFEKLFLYDFNDYSIYDEFNEEIDCNKSYDEDNLIGDKNIHCIFCNTINKLISISDSNKLTLDEMA